jgi:hypothetical protein
MERILIPAVLKPMILYGGNYMVRKSKKAIVGKHTIPGSGTEFPGAGLDLVDENLTSSKEIEKAEHQTKERQGLE